MGLRFETRGSDSPWVDTVWSCASDQVVEMTSVASTRWGLVFWQQDGAAYAAVTGPETRAAVAPVPEGATFVGIDFAVGTSLRTAPTPALVGDVVGKLDYFDEPHLAHALRRYVGRTARQLRDGGGGAIALDLAQLTTS